MQKEQVKALDREKEENKREEGRGQKFKNQREKERRVQNENKKRRKGRPQFTGEWKVRIPVERRCLCAVDVVPPVTCELLLVEQRTIGAEKRGALMTLPPIVADMVRLYIRNTSACDATSPSTMLHYDTEHCL